MPLPAEISIPGYLEPPSQAQREQMDMAQQQLREKAAVQMQRRIAMAKLMGDANQLQAAGLDPTEARQQALVKNAPSLFPDDPETMLHITTQVQTALARKQAVQDYKNELAAGIKEGLTTEAASARAWAKHGPDISTAGFFPGLTRLQTTQEQIADKEKSRKQQLDEFKQREERIKGQGLDKLDLQGLQLSERTRVDDAKLALEERKVQVQEKKAEQTSDQTLPEVETINGVRVIHMPGSKRFQVLKQAETLKEYLLKNMPRLVQNGGMKTEEAADFLTKTWGEAQKTEPVSETAPARVRVRKPDGTIGTISSSLLDQALKEGWQEVK